VGHLIIARKRIKPAVMNPDMNPEVQAAARREEEKTSVEEGKKGRRVRVMSGGRERESARC